jgi:hypothetical protein
MLSSLITSQTRIKLLLKFFLNCSTKAHLRGLESEFGESSNAIRVELNRFEEAGLLNSEWEGNRKVFHANCEHPLFKDIHSILLKETGIDLLIEKVVHRLGSLDSIYLTGDFARGRDSSVIELILIGRGIDREYLSRKIEQAEALIKRKVSFVIFDSFEAERFIANSDPADLLPLWRSTGIS